MFKGFHVVHVPDTTNIFRWVETTNQIKLVQVNMSTTCLQKSFFSMLVTIEIRCFPFFFGGGPSTLQQVFSFRYGPADVPTFRDSKLEEA